MLTITGGGKITNTSEDFTISANGIRFKVGSANSRSILWGSNDLRIASTSSLSSVISQNSQLNIGTQDFEVFNLQANGSTKIQIAPTAINVNDNVNFNDNINVGTIEGSSMVIDATGHLGINATGEVRMEFNGSAMDLVGSTSSGTTPTSEAGFVTVRIGSALRRMKLFEL